MDIMKKITIIAIILLAALTNVIGFVEAADPLVSIVTEQGSFDIKAISGDFRSVAVPMFGFRRFVEFPISASPTRFRDARPQIIIKFEGDPHEAYWLVRLNPWEDILVLDLDSPSIWAGGATTNDPDADSDIPYSAEEESPGTWRITPKEYLPPGEYGLFRWGQRGPSISILFAFGIDEQ